MVQISDDTILIGTTELRTELPKLTKKLDEQKVIVMNRGKPVAVLEDFESYETREKLLDELDDLIAGYIAKERFENSKPENYIDHATLLKRLGLKKK